MLEESRLLWSGQSLPYSRPGAEELIAAIQTAVGGQQAPASAVGLCVPGLMDKASATITLSVNVPALAGVRLDQLLEIALGYRPARLEFTSDAVATGYDIATEKDLRGRLLLLALGTGIGAAVLDDGRPLSVDGDSPGHWGQVDVSLADQAPLGPDGGQGSLEAYLGAPALVGRYGSDLERVIAGWRGDEPPLRALARAIRIGHAIYRPHHVCLAGGIGIRLGHVLAPLRRVISANLSSVARPDWTLSVADNPHHAARGAAKLALQ